MNSCRAALLSLLLLTSAAQAQEKQPQPPDANAVTIATARAMLAGPVDKDKLVAWTARLRLSHRPVIYEWLKTEIKPLPAYAAHARVMALLAHSLKVPQQEIDAAEQMDLQLNKEDPDVWLRRAVSYAKAGKDDWALDLFLEAVRRTNFAEAPAFIEALAPPQTGWLDRAVAAGRMDELASCLGEALQNTPATSAQNIAAVLLRAFIRSADNPARMTRRNRLLQVALQHQRHLLLVCFDTLSEAASAADRAGHADEAALLARMALRGVWPTSMTQEIHKATATIDGMPHGVYDALTGWGGSSDEVRREASIMPLFHIALRGADAQEFMDDLVSDARLFPEDEQLVSCALMARALRGTLSAAAFTLADKLDDQQRMRAAWRLCMLAPRQNISLESLAPVLARGVAAIFQSKRYTENGQRHFILGTQLLPWLEEAGAKEEIRGLLPLLVKSITNENTFNFLGYYAVLAAEYGAQDMMPQIVEKWQAQCAQVMKEGHESQGWLNGNLIWLCRTIQYADAESVSILADLAGDIWQACLTKQAAAWDPLAESAGWLCDSLLAAGKIEKLKSQASDVARILSLGGEPDFAVMARRIHHSIGFLDETVGRLPTPYLWVEHMAQDEHSARLHWRTAFDLSGSALNLRGYKGSPVETEVVPRSRDEHYELHVFVGPSPDALRPLKVVATGLAGSAECRDLPAAGWLSAEVRSPRTGAVHWGAPVRYSLHAPLIDSMNPVADPALPWRDAWVEQYGRPASNPVPITDGIKWLVTTSAELSPDHDAPPSQPELVVLDENKVPVRTWPWHSPASKPAPESGRVRTSLLDPSEPRLGADKPRFLIMTVRSPAPFPRLPFAQVRLFARESAASVPEPPPLLDHQHVARVGFPVSSWCLAESFPRAAVCGPGHLVVFDTSKTPWVERLHLQDPQIGERDRVFMLGPDDVRLFQPQPQPRTPEGRIFLVPCGAQPPARLQDCARATVPFVATHVEASPDGSSVVFLSQLSSTGYRRPFQMGVAWMNGPEGFETSVFQTSVMLRWALPQVAWWSGPDTAVIDSRGGFCQVHRSAEGLEIKRLEEAPATPPAAVLGQLTHKTPWLLKHPQLLVRRDVTTGSMLDAYKLREKTIGTPMWWKTPGHPVLLQTARYELISVRPSPADEK